MKTVKKKVLFISSYPPRECGIATFTRDLARALDQTFSRSFEIKVAALEESDDDGYIYPDEVIWKLNAQKRESYSELAGKINNDESIFAVCLQHEFGLLGGYYGNYVMDLINQVHKPFVVVFHSVLPDPNAEIRRLVNSIANSVDGIIVMTKNSGDILLKDYSIPENKIHIIPHGIHHVTWKPTSDLKRKYGFEGKRILSTFGLLSENKSIETALYALPEIVRENPDVIYLILGKTHPKIVQKEGEKYRNYLMDIVRKNQLDSNVVLINRYLETSELLEYLRLSDLYLFTSKDPNQAVSGTFVYALSCACPVITTPIPHALEILKNDVGSLFNFGDHQRLAAEVNTLLADRKLMDEKSFLAYSISQNWIWPNSAIRYMKLFSVLNGYTGISPFSFNKPKIQLNHLEELTDRHGLLQFSKINVPDTESGYTLDDNARALIAVVMHYVQTGEPFDNRLIRTYLQFISQCQLEAGNFFNYMNGSGEFHVKNRYVNLEDANGRAIWSLGFFLRNESFFPEGLIERAETVFRQALSLPDQFQSPRAIAFSIKGLYYYYQNHPSDALLEMIERLACKLTDGYRASSHVRWQWFEEYLTYANGAIPESILMAYHLSGKSEYLDIALSSFNFLLSQTIINDQVRVISNRGWHRKGERLKSFGEQPIDVAYTIMALDTFYEILKIDNYKKYLDVAISWFLGNNRLGEIMYDPNTGGCYDGLEETGPNMNQGAESMVCFLISELISRKYDPATKPHLPAIKTPHWLTLSGEEVRV